MIVEQYTDMAGKIRITWQSIATGNIYQYKFATEPTEQKLQALSDQSDIESDLQKVGQVDLSILTERHIILQFIEKVKDTPNVNLTQYNTYLGTLHWTVAAVIRFFVYMIASRLADRKEVSLPNMNESTVLAAVRDFIVNTPARNLVRLIFNSYE